MLIHELITIRRRIIWMKEGKGGKGEGGKGKASRLWVSKKLSSVAHPTRQGILKCLEAGPRTTRDLEKELGQSRYNLYHHLKTLKEEGLIVERLEGRQKVFELRPRTNGSLDALTREVEEIQNIQQQISLAQGIHVPEPAATEEDVGQPRSRKVSRELELEQEKVGLLNRLLEQTGSEPVVRNKKYRVIVMELDDDDLADDE